MQVALYGRGVPMWGAKGGPTAAWPQPYPYDTDIAKARALLHGRHHVSVKDIQALAKPILRHRVLPNFYAEAEGITSDRIVDQLLDAVPVPASGL